LLLCGKLGPVSNQPDKHMASQADAQWPAFGLDNTYARDLAGTYHRVQPAHAPQPRTLFFNQALAEELGLAGLGLDSPRGALFFTGQRLPPDADPIAQAYAGHQFGGFSPQLGDGRALLIGERLDRQGRRRDLALKGSGRTPFSRGGDGKAAVGPMLREVLVGEYLHAVGVPTTRALAVAATGDSVLRDRVLPGAILTRVAASHLRVGTLQYFAARGELETLQRVFRYALQRHDPQLHDAQQPVLAFFEAVARRQAALIASWTNLGFIHGVMNTDNMALSGESIDFGPCAFLETYDPATVFSSIDHGGRYAFGNQPHIARWNLARLAEALLPLMADPDDPTSIEPAVAQVTGVIDAFPGWFEAALRQGQRIKLGLEAPPGDDRPTEAAKPDSPPRELSAQASALADDWLALLQRTGADHTLAWRSLADGAAATDDPGDPRLQPLLDLLAADVPGALHWWARWRAVLDATGLPAVTHGARLRQANPGLIPRNARVEDALEAATAGELQPFHRLLDALRAPFERTAAWDGLETPATPAEAAGYQTFCGT
jgi:uncharacterized protein YdiU (UPF0061 family)